MEVRDRILIIEDDRSIRKFFRTILEANRYDVISADTGEEGYSLITSQCPDLVILDLIRLLERILTIKEKDFAPVHSATHSNAVMYVVKYIRENFATASLNDVAASLHYSPAYLSQLLKERLGMNFYQLLDFRRSVVGRNLLLESREPMDAIALKLGFQSYAGFYKFWKKQQGMSPKEYRKKFSQENVKIDRDIHRIR